MTALVSTIIPVFNRAAMLTEAVQSVLSQSYQAIDIIIVDNASTDDTATEIARLVMQHPDKVRSYYCAVTGAGAAREMGRLHARGDYIQYLDSDDLLMPNKFALQVDALQNNTKCDIAYGTTRFRGSAGQILHEPWKGTGQGHEQLFPSMLMGRWWGTSTPLYRRSALDRNGAWLNISNEEDWEYDCRLAAAGVRLSFVDTLVSEERDHIGGRLSRGGSEDVNKLKARAEAHVLILQHALSAGITLHSEAMQHFSRALFLLARQCGAAGLQQQSKQLFELSRTAAQPSKRNALDYRLYRLLTQCLGWKVTAQLAQMRDCLRSK